MLANLFRNRGAINFVKARPPPRVYNIDELRNNHWHLPDETLEVDWNNIREAPRAISLQVTN